MYPDSTYRNYDDRNEQNKNAVIGIVPIMNLERIFKRKDISGSELM